MRQFVERAFGQIGRGIARQGEGDTERGIDANTGEILVEVEPKLRRPAEVQFLLGDASKAKRELWWVPKTLFSALVEEMVKAGVARNG
jgi:GDPmannose 4,6-dehydratase